MVVLVGPGVLGGLGDQVIRQLATAGGAICYAIAVIIAQRMPRTPMVGRAALVLIFSVIQTVPLSLYLSGGGIPPMTFKVLWPAVYLGLFPTAMATLVLFKLLSEREASFVAFQNYLVPVFGVLWGALLLSEEVTPEALAALGLISVWDIYRQYQAETIATNPRYTRHWARHVCGCDRSYNVRRRFRLQGFRTTGLRCVASAAIPILGRRGAYWAGLQISEAP